MADHSFLEWPFFQESHRKLAHELEEWCRSRKWSGEVESVEEVDEACRKRVHDLASTGWLRWCVPKAFGGQTKNLDVRSLCIIREILARHDALADFSFAMQGLGSGAVSCFGTSDQQERFLPAIATGESIAGFALTEPDAGSDVANLTTYAEPTSKGWNLNGSKTWISNGGIADFYTLFARTEKSSGTSGLSAFILEAKTLGLEICERLEVIAPHPLARIELKDAFIPKDLLLGESGHGFRIAMATLDIFRPTVGAAALGFARRAFDEALGHSGSREMYGQSMQQLPVVRAKLGEMALKLDASALLIYRAAWAHDLQSGRTTREASMAKLYATEAAQEIIDTAVQLFGARGVQKGNPAEALYREIRALRIYEGSSEVHQQILGQQAIRLYTGQA
jgi:acyl-CoA dehydrogenase